MTTIEKKKVTAAELKDIIQQRLGCAAFLTVHRADQGLGFTVGVIAAPAKVIAIQQAVDAIVQELRAHYELVDG